jgi:hypothetical protein
VNNKHLQVRQFYYPPAEYAEYYGPYPIYGPEQFIGFSQQPPFLSPKPFGGGLGSFNMKDIKGMIDRLGGIDGLLATMGKVQRLISGLQQMQPLIKLFVGMMSPSKAKTTEADEDAWKPARRKRSRKRKKAYAKTWTSGKTGRRNRQR